MSWRVNHFCIYVGDSSRLKDLEDLSNLLQFTNYEVPDKERKIKLFPLTENPVQGFGNIHYDLTTFGIYFCVQF